MIENPNIEEVMTATPHTIDVSKATREARQMMSDYSIRHLPVMFGSNLVGVISERDLVMAEMCEKASNCYLSVGDICIKDSLYTIPPTTKLNTVAKHMARQGIGSALVIEHGNVLGIFTAVDACRVLGEDVWLESSIQ